MATKKKDFTTADGAIDKMFSTPLKNDKLQEHDDNNANINQKTYITHDMNNTDDTINTKQTNDIENTINSIHTYNTENTINTKHTNNAKPTNKSKHYNERGKRAERFALLLDEQLKIDLRHLSMAKGNKSINDLIITVLLEYIEREENQIKLEQYRQLLQT